MCGIASLVLGQIEARYGTIGMWPIVACFAPQIATISLIGPNSMALALQRYPHMAGTASSLMGVMQFGIGSLFGASAYLARTLVDTPELIDLLVQLGQTPPKRTKAQIAFDLDQQIARADASDPEAVWSAIAEVKNGHVLRVGLADFAGALDPLAVCTELTAIADRTIRQDG